MSRLRLALLALLLALAVPVVALVARALSSIEFERRVRHEAVAERVFDEMERALTRFLEHEEARPAEEYRFYSQLHDGLPEGDPAQIRSPLSRPSSEPFVIAHFQLDPDGSLSSPLQPWDERFARLAGDWPATGGEAARIDEALLELEQRVAPFWREARVRRRAAPPSLFEESTLSDFEEREPGDSGAPDDRAMRLARVARRDRPEERQALVEEESKRKASPVTPTASEPDKKARPGKTSAYEVLQSLNRGAQERQLRKQVVTEAPRSRKFAKQEAEQKPATVLEQKSDEPAAEGYGAFFSSDDTVDSAGADPAEAGEAMSSLASRAPASEPARSPSPYPQPGLGRSAAGARDSRSAPAQSPPPDVLEELALTDESDSDRPAGADDRVRVILEPMAGQRIDANHLLLYRTVLVGGQGYRQGMLLDEQALGRWLESEVIGESTLAGSVALSFGQDADESAAPNDYYVSRHAFAEPFDGLRARLALAPLRGLGSTFTIYALAGLLAVVALAGMAAVYRMVSVVVHFAERRSNFVSAVSHELKTPLTAIRMYGEMLRDGLVSSDEKREEYYQTISDESERLSRLIDNVLEFSRLEKGSREFNLSVGALRDVVEDVCHRLRPHVEREGFALRVEAEDDLPPVRFDRDALVQMLFNLVDNAMKYSAASGQREIIVRCARAEDGRVALTVRDFGPGVPRQQLGRIFEPFFRGEAELTRSTRGSGIGLALVKQLAESMDAAVSGANAEGGGFRVSIAFAAG